MICSYCGARTNPGAVVCNNCGVILRAGDSEKRLPKPTVKRGSLVRIAAIAIAAIAGAIVGKLMLPVLLNVSAAVGTAIGVAAGAALVYLVSGGKILYYSNLYRTRHAFLQSRIRNVLSSSEQKYEKLLEKDATTDARLSLAVAHLLQDEVEKSVQEFQRAQKMGAKEPLFFNNAGVALARRGSIPQSLEMFQRASSLNGHHGEPHANLAHAIVQSAEIVDEMNTERALSEVQCTIEIDGDKPLYHDWKGLILCRAKKYDMAIEEFQKSIDCPGYTKFTRADAHNNIAVALFMKSDVKGAVTEIQTALRLDPSHGRALSNHGILMLLQGNAASGLETLQSARKLDPKSAPVRNNLGYGMCRVGALNEGIREFRDGILLDPGIFEPYYNLGKIYLDADVLEVAERNLTRALQLNSQSWETLVAVGLIRMHQGQMDTAQELLSEANTISPKQPLTLGIMGICHTKLGNYKLAERLLLEASDLDEGNSELHAHLGLLYLHEDSITVAGERFAEAISIDPKVAEYHNNIGLCQISNGAYDSALNSFRKCETLHPEYTKTHYHLGYVFALQKHLDAAVKEWEQTVKVEGAFPDGHVNLGVAYYQKENYEKAATEFRRVIGLRQNRMEDFSNLALALSKQGILIRKGSRTKDDAKWKESVERHKQALEMFDRALVLEPSNVMLHSNRGLSCFFANRPEDAMKEWAIVSKLDPNYARKREKQQQSEFDDTAVTFVSLNLIERAATIKPRTADYVYQLAAGYDTDRWSLMISDDALKDIPELDRQSRQLERSLQALSL
ncbi:MAG: tetratricopeptide repeat protein [Capsulimonas sp.]|uniref:tetratricopeptide repeat protein n=1 Tax=Capsulimonas sp. TaxID=2494211 RepID=UPI0032653489